MYDFKHFASIKYRQLLFRSKFEFFISRVIQFNNAVVTIFVGIEDFKEIPPFVSTFKLLGSNNHIYTQGK